MHNIILECMHFQGLDNWFDFTGLSLQTICNGILLKSRIFFYALCKLPQVLYTHMDLDID